MLLLSIYMYTEDIMCKIYSFGGPTLDCKRLMILRYTQRQFVGIKRAHQTPYFVLQIPTLIYKK